MEEKKIISLVKKEKIENIILKLVLIIICLMTLVLNLNEYKQIFLEKIYVHNNVTIENAIDTDSKFISIDVSKAKETRFSLEHNNKEEAKVYELNYGEKSLLLVLNKNTALTGNVQGELLGYDTNLNKIKDKLMTENNSKYYDRYFSDMDYNAENNLTKKKFYITVAIISILLISIIIDFIKFFNPKKTKLYKKIYKKMYKIKK